MLLSIVQFCVGLFLLYFSAEWLVISSSSLAMRLKIPMLFIGLTIMAIGTSIPELMISLKAAINGQDDIAIGNIVGSNIFNISVILGVSSFIIPLKSNLKSLRVYIPVLIFSGILLCCFFWDMKLTRVEGIVFLLLFIAFVYIDFQISKRAERQNKSAATIDKISFNIRSLKNSYHEILIIFISLIVLMLGTNIFIIGSVEIARIMGISQSVIGLTIIAASTSLPELAASLIAVLDGKPELALGNILGSNIFNILGIIGISALGSPLTLSGIKAIDLLVLLFFSLTMIPFMWSGFRFRYWGGIMFLAGYITYATWLFF